MKLYDISQEVFSCNVYPGDPAPQKQTLASIEDGDLYHLTAFSMCAHNGTHLDAPYHFLQEGKTIDALPLGKTVGYAYLTFLTELSAPTMPDVFCKTRCRQTPHPPRAF